MPSKGNKNNKKSGGNPAMIAMIKKQQEQRALELERIKKEQEEEERLQREYELELIREEEEKARKAEENRLKKEKEKKEGRHLSKAQKKKLSKARTRLPMVSTSVAKSKEIISEEKEDNKINIDDKLRSPICVVLGHVDTGKTKLLDKIRNTNVQNKEVGGITQQIGASYFPIDVIREKTKDLDGRMDFEYNLPGILIIDTPGHETFSNLRHRGSSLCDIAILVVDIMHGLEQQTLESIKILKDSNIPFVIALNKIDRIYGWKKSEEGKDISLKQSVKNQSKDSIEELEYRIKGIKTELAEQGLNTEICFKNHQLKKVYSLVPVSAITGDGISDLLALMVFLTQKWMNKKLNLLTDVKCSVMEVKTEEGLGTTIDVILSNGILKEGDKIILATLNGIVETNIRALLTPQPLREMRVKDKYTHHKEIKASMGIKIVANDLENVIAGTNLVVINENDSSDEVKNKYHQVESQIDNFLNTIECQDNGVFVKASTLGSLEAFVALLKEEKIPISGVSIGQIYKKDITKALTGCINNPLHQVILAFNIKVTKDMEQLANTNKIRIIQGEIVYNIVDEYKKFCENFKNKKKESISGEAIFPCKVQMLGKKYIFNNKNPYVFGVKILEGRLKLGTPLFIPSVKSVLGKVTSIEKEHNKLEIAKKGDEVCIKVETDEINTLTFGRQISDNELLCSNINRQSIDLLKELYLDEMKKEDWLLVIELKKILGIQ